MVTIVGSQEMVVEALVELMELEFDASEAYKAALSRIESAAYREKLEGFARDHERHRKELAPLIRKLGATVPTEGDLKSVLTTGKVVAGDFTGGDLGILRAMKSNEDDTNTAYENMCERMDLAENERELMKACLADERRHRSWLERTLKN